MFNKIFYINLAHRTDRNNNIIQQLKQLNLLHIVERIDAVNGKNLDINTICCRLITHKGKYDVFYGKSNGLLLTKGAIGCALSHYKIYQKIVSENIPAALILEDDININNNFYNILQSYNQYIPKDYDILYVGYHDGCIKYFTPTNNQFYTKSSLVWGTFGYIVTRCGAEKLLKIFPINHQIDSEISINFNKINAYVVLPNNRLVTSTSFDSDIQHK